MERSLLILFAILITNISFANQDQIDKILTQLKEKYSIQFVYKDIPESTWKEVNYINITDYEELYKYLQIFSKEFNKYPVCFVKATGIKYIAYVRDLNYNGQYRAALPDAYKEILFYDVNTKKDLLFERKRTKYYLRHSIHHEIYHMLEQEIYGDMYYKDSTWISFNYSGFTYGNGGESLYIKDEKKKKITINRKKSFETTYPEKGMITIYSLSALEEDKCEVFTSLFIPRERRKVNRLFKKDEIVKNKIEYMQFFLRTLCPEMNECYWEKL